ncbi:hypothetical protein MPRM_16070 [Mycobacterium parmense]|uniref:Uncharacterized protein n=1 Tax=Mycobacterium parmense TaxID=185642 RepID=A0A7I7YR03_9MYCO|nr:hypothetical protein MPRM_16070 [Mycobacterium parmense]
MVEEQQAKVRLQPVDDQTPQLLIAAEPMRQDDRWAAWRADDLDIVPGANIHAPTLGCPGLGPRMLARAG